MPGLQRLARILLGAETASVGGSVVIDLLGPGGGTDLIGRIAAEGGRICWAVARGQVLRVSDIFVEETSMTREVLEAVFQASNEGGRPFGEELLRRGLVRDEQLRSCLRRQMVAALGALCEQWKGQVSERSWSVEEGPVQGYDPAFTAAPLDILMACLDQVPSLRREVQSDAQLSDLFAVCAGASLCLRRVGSGELPLVPVGVSRVGAMTLGAALRIGREALAVLRPPALEAACVSPFAVLSHGDGRGVVCALDEPHVYVFEVEERWEYGSLLSRFSASARASEPEATRVESE